MNTVGELAKKGFLWNESISSRGSIFSASSFSQSILVIALGFPSLPISYVAMLYASIFNSRWISTQQLSGRKFLQDRSKRPVHVQHFFDSKIMRRNMSSPNRLNQVYSLPLAAFLRYRLHMPVQHMLLPWAGKELQSWRVSSAIHNPCCEHPRCGKKLSGKIRYA